MFLLSVSINIQAQNDAFILSAPPQNEINFKFGFGAQSQIQYQVEQGKNPFLPSKNHAWEANATYATSIERLWKISTGLIVGAGSLETPFEITNEQFPGIDQYLENDFSSGYFGITNQWYSDVYIAIPLTFHYNLFQIGSKHRIWANAGIEFQYLFPVDEKRSFSVGSDTASTLELLEFSFIKNADRNFKLRFNVGLEYRFQLPYYHELSFGINYAFHSSDMYSGTYEILQFDPNNAGNGTFTNRMDLLSMSLGYSINFKRKRNKKYQNHKNHQIDELILPPDTMPNVHEYRFGTNPGLYAWNQIDVPNTAATMDPKVDKFQITSFTFHYLKYFKNNTAWYTGLDADFGAYNFNFAFDKKDYPYLLTSYTIQHQELSSYFNFPFGLHQNIRLGKKSMLEISGALTLSINLSGSYAVWYYGQVADSGIVVFRADAGKINFITPGGQLNIGYAHETKRKNKWVIGLRGTMNFIKSYTIDYEILNPDKSYYAGKINMQPFNFQIYWRYALTGKRRRYIKAVGY
jgi:hypothetical protein